MPEPRRLRRGRSRESSRNPDQPRRLRPSRPAVDGRHRQLQRAGPTSSGSSTRWRPTPEFASGRCEVVVVDNASPEARSPTSSTRRPAGRPARSPGPTTAVSPPASTPAGALPESPWLLVLNPDVVVPSGLLGQVVDRIDRFEDEADRAAGDRRLRAAQPRRVPRSPRSAPSPAWPGPFWEQLIPRSRRKYQAGWRIRPGPVDWVTGACMLVNTATARRAGGDGRGLLPLPRGGRPLPLGPGPGLAGRVRPERGGRPPTSLAKSGDFAQDAGHHAAQQAALLPQTLARAGSSWGSPGS